MFAVSQHKTLKSKGTISTHSEGVNSYKDQRKMGIWHAHVVLTRETEAGELLEPRSSRPTWLGWLI